MDQLTYKLKRAVEDIKITREIGEQRGQTGKNSRKSQSNRLHFQYSNRWEKGEVRVDGEEEGIFKVIEGSSTFNVTLKTGGCNCSKTVNSHCRFCDACYYSMRCSCLNTKPGVACIHLHATKSFITKNSNISSDDSDDDSDDIEIASDLNCDDMESACDMDCDTPRITEYDAVDGVVTKTSYGSEHETYEQIIGKLETEMPELSLSQGKQSLDIVNSVMISTSRGQNGKSEQFLELLGKIEELSEFVKQRYPEHVPSLTVRREVLRNAGVVDPTMRDKMHLSKRKKRKLHESMPIGNRVSDDEIDFCAICTRMDPEGAEELVSWLKCSTCQLWVHKTCAENRKGECEICNKKFVAPETMI